MKGLFLLVLLFPVLCMAQLVGSDIEQSISLTKIALSEKTLAAWIVALPWILLVISEALSYITKVKANGIFQAMFNFLKSVTGKKE